MRFPKQQTNYSFNKHKSLLMYDRTSTPYNTYIACISQCERKYNNRKIHKFGLVNLCLYIVVIVLFIQQHMAVGSYMRPPNQFLQYRGKYSYAIYIISVACTELALLSVDRPVCFGFFNHNIHKQPTLAPNYLKYFHCNTAVLP